MRRRGKSRGESSVETPGELTGIEEVSVESR
jgi:hypothetical protein